MFCVAFLFSELLIGGAAQARVELDQLIGKWQLERIEDAGIGTRMNLEFFSDGRFSIENYQGHYTFDPLTGAVHADYLAPGFNNQHERLNFSFAQLSLPGGQLLPYENLEVTELEVCVPSGCPMTSFEFYDTDHVPASLDDSFYLEIRKGN